MNYPDLQLVDEIMKAGRKYSKAKPGSPGQSRAEALSAASPPPGGPATPHDERAVSSEENRLLADLGTTLWRMQKVVMEPETDRPRRGMKVVVRHLNSAWDALRQRGLKVQNHSGCKFDTGQSLVVLAFQPTAGLTHEVVLETVKPTLYLKGTVIQMGEVIVGIPQALSEPGPTLSTPLESSQRIAVVGGQSATAPPGITGNNP